MYCGWPKCMRVVMSFDTIFVTYSFFCGWNSTQRICNVWTCIFSPCARNDSMSMAQCMLRMHFGKWKSKKQMSLAFRVYIWIQFWLFEFCQICFLVSSACSCYCRLSHNSLHTAWSKFQTKWELQWKIHAAHMCVRKQYIVSYLLINAWRNSLSSGFGNRLRLRRMPTRLNCTQFGWRH